MDISGKPSKMELKNIYYSHSQNCFPGKRKTWTAIILGMQLILQDKFKTRVGDGCD